MLIYATVALLLGGDWLEQSASGLARYLLIGYVIGALIVIALTLLYTWDKVLKLVLMLLGKLPHLSLIHISEPTRPYSTARRKRCCSFRQSASKVSP